MTDLIRRALLGDREAQKECTKQGIVLPCPFCGGERTVVINAPEDWVKCRDCGAGGPMKVGTVSARIAWNTRQGPPIGRCETCSYWIKKTCYCWKSKIFGQSCRKDEYCSSWAPREETDHETD